MQTPADETTPYYRLDPDTVLQAVESTGLLSDGRQLALNSYENRVYQVGIEDAEPVVVKFYRPGRWSDAQILEEHSFSLELAEAEIPLIAPTVLNGETLFRYEGFRFTLFRRQGGHAPELEDKDTRLWLGRYIGRIHAIGKSRPFGKPPRKWPDRPTRCRNVERLRGDPTWQTSSTGPTSMPSSSDAVATSAFSSPARSRASMPRCACRRSSLASRRC